MWNGMDVESRKYSGMEWKWSQNLEIMWMWNGIII
jgi:hypothetical protein